MINVKNPQLVTNLQIGNSNIYTITWTEPNGLILILQRKRPDSANDAAIILVDYWGEGYNLIGTLSPAVSITKPANSRTLTLQLGSTLNANILTCIGAGVVITSNSAT